MRPKPDTAIARLAAEQWGVLSLHDLLQCGVSAGGVKRRLQSGRLHRLHRGVYAVGHPNIPLEGHFLAATKACGPTAVLSHYSAATLWGLVDWDDRRPEVIAATVKDHTGIRSHRSRTLRREDVTRRQGIPVTTPARTIRDLFSVLPYKGVRRAAARALSRRLLAPHHLPPRLATTIAPTRSELEDAVRDLVLANGFEPPDVNRPLTIDGRRVIHRRISAGPGPAPGRRHADSLEWSRPTDRTRRSTSAGTPKAAHLGRSLIARA